MKQKMSRVSGARGTLSLRNYGLRIGGLALVTALAAGVALLLPPIPQDPAYHDFADKGNVLGVLYIGDVASNAAFLVVGVLGFAYLFGRRGREAFAAFPDVSPYLVYFGGLVLLAPASAVYHANPTNETLFWDRLALAVAFMALFAAFIADRIDARAGVVVFLPLLVAAGVVSLVYWRWTEAAGEGDLRPYGLVQFFPLLAIPLLCWWFPGRRTNGRYVLYLLLWYAAAKVFEHFDEEIFDLLGGVVSGHTLKHLAAGVATYMVLAMLRAAPAPAAERHAEGRGAGPEES